jgi:hypothetical protein
MATRRRFSPTRPPHAVRSAPLESRERPTTPSSDRFHWDRLPLVVFGYAILGLWWAAGGKWTIEGTPLLLNEVFNFFHITYRFAPISWAGWYAWLCWLPLGISFIEHKYAPWRAWQKWGILSLIGVLFVWFVVTAADWSSTWQAITHPAPDAWRIARQVAGVPLIAGAWVTLTTFLPEIGFAILAWWLWESEKRN